MIVLITISHADHIVHSITSTQLTPTFAALFNVSYYLAIIVILEVVDDIVPVHVSDVQLCVQIRCGHTVYCSWCFYCISTFFHFNY